MSAFKDWLTSLTSKSTPIDADELYVRDSSGTPSSKKLTWANLKATLASTFLPLTGGTVAGGTATASSPVVTVTQTFNNAGVTFVGKTNDFTDTASASDSILERWKVGTNPGIQITKTQGKTSGPALLFGTTAGNTGAIAIYRVSAGSGDTGWFTAGDSHYWCQNSSTARYAMDNTSFVVGLGKSLAFASHADIVGVNTKDIYLERDAANTIAQRNGTNAQTTNRYRSYTDASNYSRVTEKWNTTTAIYHAEGLGTGSDGSVAFNDAELATNATVGFVMLPSCADAPSGTPADIPTGQVPVVFDSASSKIYAYIGGAWKSTPALT